jgi:hypothetical protein
MILFLISSISFILKTGFFDAITDSFRRFYKAFSKEGMQLAKEIDQMAMPSNHLYPFIKPMFFSSLVNLVTMLFLLFLYY